jgi:Na+-transporting NADH:ubiquinone oxidoreductase subunit A
VDGQDLLLLAQLLRSGRYPIERTVVVAGPAAPQRRHVRTRLGVPLAHLLPEAPAKGTRLIAGGVLTGYAASPESYLGMMEKALNLVPEGDGKGEFLGFVRPGYRKPTYSRTFASRLHRNPLATDCNTHGGVRACIACGYCAEVCPVEILPQFAYKAVLAGEVEEALAHGLLDCVECALCSYVCPSKLELVETFKTAKAQFMREQGRR